jgi:GNAT superfamily N-acetyltransferase
MVKIESADLRGSLMKINEDLCLAFKEPDNEDMMILERWYGMTDCFGYATGFKDFSDIRQRLRNIEPGRLIFMIHNLKQRVPVGFVLGQVKKNSDEAVLWVNILIIEPSSQNKGLGTHAINKLLKYAQIKYGVRTCLVAVSYKNKQGLSFWEKVGFSRSPELERSLHQHGTSQVAILKRTIK